MEIKRKPLQGVSNIVRFNWPFYVLSVVAVIALFYMVPLFSQPFDSIVKLLGWLTIFSSVVSLLVSMYVYDVSCLYKLSWLDKLNINDRGSIVNINAGFDEFSGLLNAKYPDASLTILDFYHPDKHTEASIRRARKAYPAYKGTLAINTFSLPSQDASVGVVFLMMAAHEIRDDQERVVFFKELNRILDTEGQIIITEHLRDTLNFLAYNIGFLHFLSRSSWARTFRDAGLTIIKEIKITPFITTFILHKNGTAS